MKKKIDVPGVGKSVGWEWDKNARMECRFEGKDLVIYANEEALEGLASGALSLAREITPEWHDIYFQVIESSENAVEFQKRVDFTTEVNH